MRDRPPLVELALRASRSCAPHHPQVGGGEVPKDSDILDWANSVVAESGAQGVDPITSFKDPSLANGTFLLSLLSGVEPKALNPDLVSGRGRRPVVVPRCSPPSDLSAPVALSQVTAGEDAAERENNAKYVISVARKVSGGRGRVRGGPRRGTRARRPPAHPDTRSWAPPCS